tara:strand:- start:338 stop:649 length:312 start_codon:yes stop_codon:yes gene_type:complete
MEYILFESFALAILMVPVGVVYLVLRAIERTRPKANQWTCAFFAVGMSVALLCGWFPVGTTPGGSNSVLRILSIVAIIGAVVVAVRGFKSQGSLPSSDDRGSC